LLAYPALVAAGLFAGLALDRPELVVAVAPFALALLVGVVGSRRPEVDVRFQLAAEWTVEGEPVDADLVLAAGTPVDQVEVLLAVPAGLEVRGAANPAAYRL